MTRVLVTGANGFIGRAVTRAVRSAGFETVCAVRAMDGLAMQSSVRTVSVGDIGAATDWRHAMDGVEVVLHLAGRSVNVGDESGSGSGLRAVNVEGTDKLLNDAIDAGVRRFILVSTIKVHGERTAPGSRFRASDRIVAPTDPYARSKWEAEQVLWRHAREGAIEAVVVRPPLVYGPFVKANFLTLLALVRRGVPLPLGSVCNERSLIYVDNLADVLVRCVQTPTAGGETFLVSDGASVSSPALLRMIGVAMGRPARLIPVPPALLRVAGALSGRRELVDRVIDSLAVDDEKTREMLEWEPRLSTELGLRATVDWYLGDNREVGA